MPRSALVLALSVSSILPACGAGTPGLGRIAMCRDVAEPPAAPPPAPPPADPAFAELRAFRNYYDLGEVRPFRHHFVVSFHCLEPSVAYFAVAEDGTVEPNGGAWGGIAVRDGEPAPIPPEQQARAEAVLAALDAEYERERDVRIAYVGSYREVEVRERIPDGPPGDPYRRMVWHATLTLRADAALTSIDGFARLSGGQTRMCWKDSSYQDCGPPRWIPFSPRVGAGAVQLPALVQAGSAQPDDERARFAAAVLAAARAAEAGEPGATLDDIHAGDGGGLLPAGLDVPMRVGFTLYARPDEGGAQADASVVIDLPAAAILAGEARGTARATVAGVAVTADVTIRAGAPGAPAASGERTVPLTIAYALTDDRGHVARAEVELTATALVDGAAAVFRAIERPDGMAQAVHDPPWSVELPGPPGFRVIDAYLGFAPSAPPWWGPASP